MTKLTDKDEIEEASMVKENLQTEYDVLKE